MEDQNDLTVRTYQEHFDTYKARTPSVDAGEFSAWIDKIIFLLPEKASVFELGSATGRDARYFRSHGVTITCTDIVPEALAALEKDGFKTAFFDFRDEPKPEWLGAFDGLFANAVLLHAPEKIFRSVLGTIGKIVKQNGIIAFSLKTGEGEAVTTEKMDAPRYFRYHTEKELRETLAAYPYTILSIDYADNGKWMQVILRNRK